MPLSLRHPWGISRGTTAHKDNVLVTLTAGGLTGRGEAAPTVRNGESVDTVMADLERVAADLGDETEPPTLLATLDRLGVRGAAAAAVDTAVHDLLSLREGVALHRFLATGGSALPVTSFSIGIDTPETVAAKVEDAAEFPVLKVKLGSAHDREIIAAVRSVTDKPLRVDANEGWQTCEEALEKVGWLAGEGVEFVEQPLPAGRLKDTAWLRERSPLPIVADEDAMTSADVPALAGAYDGINIKLAKCGGLRDALRMFDLAAEHGLKTMLGCMIESSVGITAAAHLGARADWLDLDGHLLIADDPFVGVGCDRGRLTLPELPGLGVTLASRGRA